MTDSTFLVSQNQFRLIVIQMYSKFGGMIVVECNRYCFEVIDLSVAIRLFALVHGA